MNRIFFKITREIAYIISGVLSILLLHQEYTGRCVLNICLLLCFLYTSRLYEKKRGIISVGYLFIFIILFIDNSVCAAYYTPKRVDSLHGIHGFWAGDHYLLYFFVTVICYFLICIYLYAEKRNDTVNISVNLTAGEIRQNNTGAIVLLVLFLISGNNEFLVPCFVFFILLFIFRSECRIFSMMAMIVFMIAGGYIILQLRFMLIQIMLPVMICFVFMKKWKMKITMMKANVALLILCVMAGIYGIVSEVIKLNLFWGGNYTIAGAFASFNTIEKGISRQVFRLFGIWIKLGGYIIYHVNEHGAYYGLTYIKSMAGLFGFEYVSLPVISAVYNLSTYAQPGLLAKGYANFGIMGAVANLCIVFFFMEFLTKRFIRKTSYTRMIYATVPFTKVLLDGGTLNSAIFMLILCWMLNLCFFKVGKARDIVGVVKQ